MRIAVACRAALSLAPALWLLLGNLAWATMPPLVGPVSPELSAAFERGLFSVPERAPDLETSAGRTEWLLPIIRVAFTDSALVYQIGRAHV